jgi:transglutaminase-like putative cysteine protease
MRVEIGHKTHFNYSLPVSLEPLTLRLRARSDATQTLHDFRVSITPAPAGFSDCVDLDGNNTATVWFAGLHDHLSIEVHSVIEKHDPNPFNFMIADPAALTLPVRYDADLAIALNPYLLHQADDSSLYAFVQPLVTKSKGETPIFLTLLADQIHSRFQYLLRVDGEAWSATETLQRGEGACRDFAVLFIECCRSVGIAARFVSGYCLGDPAAGSHMHAWAEVYLPGAGWRGFDPSRGLSVSEDHIAVAASHCAQDASPTHGNFRGAAEASIDAEISIRLLVG